VKRSEYFDVERAMALSETGDLKGHRVNEALRSSEVRSEDEPPNRL
jgi:hypothetical protein